MIDFIIFIFSIVIYLFIYPFVYRFVDYITDLIVFLINNKTYKQFLKYRKNKHTSYN